MRTSALTALLILASPALLIASPAQSDVVLRPVPIGSGCPITLSVQRTSPTEIVNASEAALHQRSQRIRLAFDPLGTSGIRRAEVIVHASSSTPHVLPAATVSSVPELERNFDLSGTTPFGLHEKSLWLDGVGSVLFVDLTSITYMDGSTWHRSAGTVCRAVPNGFTLIALTPFH